MYNKKNFNSQSNKTCTVLTVYFICIKFKFFVCENRLDIYSSRIVSLKYWSHSLRESLLNFRLRSSCNELFSRFIDMQRIILHLQLHHKIIDMQVCLHLRILWQICLINLLRSIVVNISSVKIIMRALLHFQKIIISSKMIMSFR